MLDRMLAQDHSVKASIVEDHHAAALDDEGGGATVSSAAMRVGQLDPVRQLVYRLTREADVRYNELSTHIGKNKSYLSQWLWRGTPKALSEDVRASLGRYFGLDENQFRLHPNTSTTRAILPKRASLRTELVDMLPHATPGASNAVVPLLPSRGPKPPNGETEVTTGPGAFPPGSLYAVWIEGDSGRLRAGDIAYIRPGSPVAPGDTVIVLDRDGSSLGVGELTQISYQRVEFLLDGETIEGDRERYKVQKVVLVAPR